MRRQLELDIVKLLKDKMAEEICRVTLCRTTKNRVSIYSTKFQISSGLPLWAFYRQAQFHLAPEGCPGPASILGAVKRNALGNYELRQSRPGAPIVAYWLAEDAQRLNDLAVKWWKDQGLDEKEYVEFDPAKHVFAKTLEQLETGFQK